MMRVPQDYPKPAVGQVWADNDRRCANRPHLTVVRIEHQYAYLSDGRREHRVLLNRMRPISTGFRLVRDVDGGE